MILCCGEALIEMSPATTATGTPAFVPQPAGTALGTALALGRLGAPAGFAGVLSTDRFGQMIAASLRAAQVDLGCAQQSDRPTTLAFLDPDGSARLHAEGSAGRSLAAPLPLPDTATALVFGGIHLGVSPCGPALEGMAMAAGPARVVMLDPNIRPALLADPAGFRARLERLIALAHVVKLSEADLGWIAGDAPREAAAAALLARGPVLVVLTHGARGATGFTAAGAQVFVPAPSVTVADRRGAGETFGAGLLTALHRAGRLTPAALAALAPAALRSALNLGVHAAAVTVSRCGPNPPLAQEIA